MAAIDRRRALAIAAAAAGLALTGSAARAAPCWEWRGTALGAAASLRLVHRDRAVARRLIAACLAEVERLEAIFSLYRPDSALCRLNRDGGLKAPPQELVALLSLSRRLSALSGGAFDVTVQPLWELYARHFSDPGADPAGPPDQAIAATLPLVGWRGLWLEPERIRLARPGMAVTLNGIAQGYVTDRVKNLLRREGMAAVLVNMGEIAAVGPKASGEPWSVALESGRTLALSTGAIATSSPDGTRFSPTCHHIFDPHTGRSVAAAAIVTAIGRDATGMDGVSTAVAAGAPPLLAERFGGRVERSL